MKSPSLIYYTSFMAEKAGLSKLAANGYRLAGKLDDPEAWFRMGRNAFRKKDWGEAIRCFTEAVRIRPNHAESHFKLGFSLLKSSRWKEAESALSKALKLDPSQSKWRVQHRIALEKTKSKAKSATATQAKKVAALNHISGFPGALKMLALAERFEEFDTLLALVSSTYGRKIPDLDSQMAVMAAERYAAQGNHARLLALGLEMDPAKLRTSHIKACAVFAEGRYTECMDILGSHLDTLASNQPAARLYARAARQAGLQNMALQVLSGIIDKAGDSLTWKEASLLVRDSEDFNTFFEAWLKFKKSRKVSAYFMKVARHVASAAFTTGNQEEAERIQRESVIAFGKNRATRPPEFFDAAVHPEYRNLPHMAFSLKDIALASIESTGERSATALCSLAGLLEHAGVPYCAIRRTLLHLTRRDIVPDLDDSLDVAVLGGDSLAEVEGLLREVTDFHAAEGLSDEGGLLRIQHVNGISIRIFLHRERDGGWIHGCGGLEWKNKPFALGRVKVRDQEVAVPEDAAAYFADFTQNPTADFRETDYLISAGNGTVVDEKTYLFTLRDHLMERMIAGDESGMLRCLHRLSDAGDSEFARIFHSAYGKFTDASLPQMLDTGFTETLKVLTLAERFEEFDKLFALILSAYGSEMPVMDSQMAVLAAERYAAQGNHARLLALGLEMNPSKLRTSHIKAFALFAEGRYTECMDIIGGHLDTLASNQPAARLYARAARQTGQLSMALQVLGGIIGKAGDSLTWKEASLLVRDREDFNTFFKAWLTFKTSRKMSTYYMKVARHVASAALTAGNQVEAERIQKESVLAFGKNRAACPPEIFDNAVHPEYRNMPHMAFALKNITLASIESAGERSATALCALAGLLEHAGVPYCAIRRTLLHLTRRDIVPGLDDSVDVAVLGGDSLAEVEELLREATDFHAAEGLSDEGGLLRFKHANGIAIRIFLHRERDGGWIHGCGGLEWKNKPFALGRVKVRDREVAVPGHAAAYFADFTQNPAAGLLETDYLISAENATVVNEKTYLFTLRDHLMERMIAGDESGVLRCLHRLSDAGEKEFARGFHGAYRNYTDANLPQLMEDRPQLVIYISGLEDVAYQCNMWIPVLEKLDARCAIVIRERRIAAGLLPTSMPVYFFESMRDLEFLEKCGVRTILYPANTQKNTNSLRFFKMNHFFINHGESDKVVNQSKFLMAYDKLLVAGPLAERRLRDAGLPVRNEQVVHVGRPQTELLLSRKDKPASAVRTILFAPTWEGFVEEANYASINEYGMQLLQALAERSDFKVLFKPHPYTGTAKPNETGIYLKRMLELAERSQNIEVIAATRPIFDCMNESDLMITDVSSVLNDYLYTLKPMILTNPKLETHDHLRAEFPSSAATYILDRGEDITSLIGEIIQDDRMFDQRKLVCADSLGEFPEGSLARFASVIYESIREND